MKIEVLFPEICCLCGDLQNARYLSRSSGAELITTSLKSAPLFASETPELIYIGSMTERSQELAVSALAPYKERLRELIDGGANILATGNAMEIFGECIEDGEASFDALGLFGFTARREMMNRYNALYVGRFEAMDIVGFKSQFSHAYGAGEIPPLFETVRGDGRSRSEKAEGVHVNGFMATYVLGPLLILNPPFAKYVLSKMGVEAPSLAFEEAATDAYRRRVAEFTDPARNIAY